MESVMPTHVSIKSLGRQSNLLSSSLLGRLKWTAYNMWNVIEKVPKLAIAASLQLKIYNSKKSYLHHCYNMLGYSSKWFENLLGTYSYCFPFIIPGWFQKSDGRCYKTVKGMVEISSAHTCHRSQFFVGMTC